MATQNQAQPLQQVMFLRTDINLFPENGRSFLILLAGSLISLFWTKGFSLHCAFECRSFVCSHRSHLPVMLFLLALVEIRRALTHYELLQKNISSEAVIERLNLTFSPSLTA